MLSGDYPYNADTVSLLVETIEKKDLDFPFKNWEYISSDAQDLLTKMLDRKPGGRITFEDCLKHRWFKRANKERSKTSESSTGATSWVSFLFRVQ